MRLALGFTPRAEGANIAAAQMIEQSLAEDRTGAVTCAQDENVEALVSHVRIHASAA